MRLLGWMFSILLVIILLLIILLNVPQVQNMVKDIGVKYLNNKLHTTVRLHHLAIDFPSSVTLDSLYVEDQSADTLVYSGHLFVKVDMIGLLAGDIHIDSIRLDDFSARITRTLPDTAFNFDYILSAFGADETNTEPEDTTSSGSFYVGAVNLSNIRLSYKDTVTGINTKATIGQLNTRFNDFDLGNLRFTLDSIKLGHIAADYVQEVPLGVDSVDNLQPIDTTTSSPMPQVAVSLFSIKDMRVHYRDVVENMEGHVALDSFLLLPEKINLNRQDIRLKEIMLSHSNIAFSMKSTEAQPEKNVSAKPEDTMSFAPWRIAVDDLRLLQNHFKFDNEGESPQKQGMDYNHLDVTNFTLLAANLLYTADSSRASLRRLTFQEQSGFDLRQLKTDAVYTDHGASLDHLLLQTGNSRLSKKLAISYSSIDALAASPGKMGIDVVIDSAVINMKDVYYFQPDLAKNKYFSGLNDQPVYLQGVVKGTLNDLAIDSLFLKAARSPSLHLDAHLANIMDPDNAKFDVRLRQLVTGRKDLQSLLPAELLPETVRIPDRLSLAGNYKGSLQSFTSDMKLKSTDGNGKINAMIKDLSDSVNASYDLEVTLNKMRLDRLLKNDTLYGPVSLNANIKGRGLTVKNMQADLNGSIAQAVLMGYNYKNLLLEGHIDNKKGEITAQMKDPNLDFLLVSRADFSDSIPAIKLELNLKNADLYALNMSQDSMKLQGKVNANIPQLDINKPNGKIAFNDWNIIYKNQNIHIDSMGLNATSTDTLKTLQLRSPVARADIFGDYKLDETADLMQYFKNAFLGVDSTAMVDIDTLSDWNMHIEIQLLQSKLWQQFLPELAQFNGAKVKGLVRSQPKSLVLGGRVKPFMYNDISVDSLRLGIYSIGDTLHYGLAGHTIRNGSISIPHFYIKGHLDSNAVFVNVRTQDQQKKDQYHFAGKLAMTKDNYKFSLLHDSLMLNYDFWNVPADNYVLYNDRGLEVNHLKLQNGNQYILANSDSGSTERPLHLTFHDFKINTLTQIALADTLEVGGVINGNVVVDSITTDPLFVTDLRIDNLAFNDMPVASLSLKVDNKQKNTYAVDMQMTGNENDVKINGTYYTTGEGSFDFDVAMNALSMKTIEAFSFGQITNTKGRLTGNLSLKGTMEQPQINGKLSFEKAGLNVTQLNNCFKLNNESIAFDPSGIHFNRFSILDSANNKAVINGDIFTEKYEHFKFDLTLLAHNYRVLNVPKGKGETYYGKVYISTNTKITGDEQLPKIDMSVKLEDNSDLTVVMMNENPELVKSEGVVEFFDPDAPIDSTRVLASDSMRYSNTLTGIDLSANIAIDTNALLNLVIDPVNGDKLSVKGKAGLNFTIDPGGKMSLTGRYDLINGAYNMSFQGLIKKEFDILRGSYITWKGDPTAAEMNITARYLVEAPALDLVQNQLSEVSDDSKNRYKQELPFYVLLNLQGELMQPDIHFELDMPEDARQAFDGSVYTRIKQINTQPSEVNKQTLGLLVLGHFIADNPFQTSGGGGAEQMVRESASKILSQQLNRLAGNLIKGVDINFDLESSQDYSTGTAQNTTNLNVGLSKSLFNDRTTIYVGGNIPLEGNNQQKASQIVGDVAVEYKLSRDGRYRLRAYRKNKYQGVIEGQYIETGLSFIIVMDYNKFKELFQSASRHRRKMRKNK